MMAPVSSRGVPALLLILGITLSAVKFCVSQSPDDLVINSICVSIGNDFNGYHFSLGQKPLYSKEAKHLYYKHNGYASGNIWYEWGWVLGTRVYAVKTNEGRYLTGWLYGEVYVNPVGPWGQISHLYAQMEDENANAIGEFHHPEELCEKGGGAVSSTIPNDLLTTCSQASPAALKVANAIVFPWWDVVVNPHMKETLMKFYEKKKEPKIFPVIWSFSHNSCDRPKKIRLRAYTETHIGDIATIRSAWVVINYVGASDILHKYRGEVAKCKEVKLSDTFKQNFNVPPIPWISGVEPLPPPPEKHEDVDKVEVIRRKTICKTHRIPKDGKAGVGFENVPSFGGRCLVHDQFNTSRGNAHQCPPETLKDLDKSYIKYSEYLENRKHCMGLDRCPCQCRAEFDVTLLGKNKTVCPGYNSTAQAAAPPGTITFIGYKTTSLAGKSVMGGRKAHGIAMTLVSMTFVPISITLARYFKETWLPRAHLQIVQVWYMAHVVLTFFSICLYVFGSFAQWRSKIVLGNSLANVALYHRSLGVLTILLFALLTVAGSLRPRDNSPFRRIVLFSHAFLGILYYFLGIATVITSSWIPGSPASDQTVCIDSTEFWPKSNLTIMPIVLAWVGFDLLFHILLTVFQCVLDKGAGFKRPMYFPLLSILKGGEEKSTKGSKLRSLLFIGYGVINGGLTFTLIGKMSVSSKAGCGFGPTTCTHSDIDTPWEKDICGI